MEFSISDLNMLLKESWSIDTCSLDYKDKWSSDTPWIGQDDITSMVVYDFFGGMIMKCSSPNGTHYFNLLNGHNVDLTSLEFLDEKPDYDSAEEVKFHELMSQDEIRDRFDKLTDGIKNAFLRTKQYKLINGEGKEYYSFHPGTLGGNKKLKIYGRLDCKSANSWLRKGYYAKNRVFFANEADAISAGYRPCAICMPDEYMAWKNENLKRVMKQHGYPDNLK